MIYFSHLLDDNEMKQLLKNPGTGLESIEFSISENLDHLDQKLQAYEKRLAYMGYPELTLHGPFLDLNPAAFDSMVAEATRTRYEQSYLAAKKLGAKKLILHTCFLPDVYMIPGWADRVADFYRRFLADKDDTVQILLENVLDPYPTPVWDIAAQLAHPAVGLCLDVGHANCYSEVAMSEWCRILEGKVRHLHVHDNDGTKDAHLALGEGTIPAEPFIPLLKVADCTVECFNQRDCQLTYDKILTIKG